MDYPKLVITKTKPESNEIEIDERDMLDSVSEYLIEIRGPGDFKGKAFYLSNRYDWVLGHDDPDTILVPVKRR